MKKYNPAKWKYHAEKDAVLVKDEDEEKKLGPGWVDAYIEKKYPKHKYRPAQNDKGFEMKVVRDKAHEKDLGESWVDSPVHFGVETTPGLETDEKISAKKPATKG